MPGMDRLVNDGGLLVCILHKDFFFFTMRLRSLWIIPGPGPAPMAYLQLCACAPALSTSCSRPSVPWFPGIEGTSWHPAPQVSSGFLLCF